MNILGIVPARGGSKRIPKKNIHPLGGIPLISHCLRTAAASPSLDRLVVSTESEEIARIVAQEQVDIIERPAELAADQTPTLPVLVHAIQTLDNSGFQADVILTIQPTYPLLTRANIEHSITAILNRPDMDSVTTVIRAPFHYHPFNARQVNRDGSISFMFEKQKANCPNTQSAPTVYYFGNLYTSRRSTILEQGSLSGRRSWPLLISAMEAMDIDQYEDLAIAEYFLSKETIECNSRPRSELGKK